MGVKFPGKKRYVHLNGPLQKSSISKLCPKPRYRAILKYRLIDTIPKVAFTTAKTALAAIARGEHC